jgi:hypothetical protein
VAVSFIGGGSRSTLYHSDISRYVSECTVNEFGFVIFFFSDILHTRNISKSYILRGLHDIT